MKKILLSLVLIVSVFTTYADEGMWIPLLLGKQVYADMVKHGLKLKPEQLYSINKASIKDAVVIFGRGCTGEIVSNDGLVFTNHHCGYDAIATASTVEHNYLRDGFWAADKSKEIPADKITVKFLDKIEDITTRVLDSLGGLTGSARSKKFNDVQEAIVKEVSGDDEFKTAVVASMFKGNQYFLYVYTVYKDVRLVGNPPESIGKFGGDTDNWEWPRHTGDFSVFRVYMSKDGKPAKYSADNVPLKPKYFFPVSLKSINDNDYSMIYGYPGGTNRYETSYGIKLATDISNPSLVKLRDVRLKYMLTEMKKDPATKLQLASSYASIANYWKFFDGETKELLKYDVLGQKQKSEAQFIDWAKGKAEFENIFADYAKNFTEWTPFAKHSVYLREGILGSPLMAYVAQWSAIEKLLKKQASKEDMAKAIKQLEESRKDFLKNENKASDKNILASVVMLFYTDIAKEQLPKGFYEDLFKTYSNIDENPYKSFASDVFSNTMAFDEIKWNAFIKNPTLEVLQKDAAFKAASAFATNYSENYSKKSAAFIDKNNDLGRMFLKGLMQMNPDKMNNTYPDANFTMRTSYGNVKSYKPKDAITCDYVCTMSGLMAKYVPGDYEFDLPAKFIELYNKKDFGQYADKKYNDVVVTFITTNDITGGNSGSPVLDAKGNLIGLAFDGNYESLNHKLSFDKDLNRTICVDVRYVLWCIEKLGGAKHIVDELKIVK